MGKKKYWRHNLVYFEGGQRVRRRFSDLDQAKSEAQLVVVKLANREGEVLKLAPVDRAHYLQACEILSHHDPELRLNLAVSEYVEADKLVRPLGIKLNQAAVEYADARSVLPRGTSLKTVVMAAVLLTTATG